MNYCCVCLCVVKLAVYSLILAWTIFIYSAGLPIQFDVVTVINELYGLLLMVIQLYADYCYEVVGQLVIVYCSLEMSFTTIKITNYSDILKRLLNHCFLTIALLFCISVRRRLADVILLWFSNHMNHICGVDSVFDSNDFTFLPQAVLRIMLFERCSYVDFFLLQYVLL